MAKTELKANLQTIDSLSKLITRIANEDATLLTSRPELEDLNFAVIRPVVAEAIHVSQQLNEFSESLLWGGQAERLLTAAGIIYSLFGQMKKFSLRGSDSKERRDKILQESESQLPENIGVLSAVLVELNVLTLFKANELDPRNLQSRMKSVHELIEQAETVSKNAKEFATAAMSGRFGNLFKKLSDKHNVVAWCWFTAAIVAALGVIGFALSLVLTNFGIEPGDSVLDADIFPRLAGRLVAISVLTSIWIWFARQHRVNRHLSVINKHRQTALESVKVILESVAESEPNQQIVMRELAHCVFSTGVTGYLGPEESAGLGPIVDLIKPSS